VYFGACRAEVSAASAISLTVTVPSGATYEPITVTNITTGLTVYSSAPFTVTFPGGGDITSSSFTNKIDSTTGSGPYDIVITDIDGDGKPDVVVTNWGSNSISLFRNTSTSGSISLASKIDSSTGINPSGVATADIDGDGKPDVVASNVNSSTMSIFRNTSTAGSISLASKIDYTTGSAPFGIAIADIDGDGKPDVVVTNTGSNTISIFPNMSISGSISFASKVDSTTGSGPYNLAIADIDGDGKPDAVVTNSNSNTISVLRNTSISGSISFASKVDSTTGSSPYNLAIADIDGDGKLDVVVTNFLGSTISVLHNTSIIGSISFAGKIDLTIGGGPYGIAISDIDGDGKPDVVITNFSNNTISVFHNTSTSGNVSFASKVDYATGGISYGIAIADIDGDGKPDVVAANNGVNTISLLRNTVGSTGVANDGSAIPTQFELMQNYPNPFNPTTTIKYQIPGTGTQYIVSLQIFDLLGREVATLVNENRSAGYYQVEWHANVASGMYLYRLEVVSISDPGNRFVDTKKMLLLK
jgi:hypothetical protein